MSDQNQPTNQQFDECGDLLVGEVTVQLPQRMIDWLKSQVEDYRMGPTPEFLDEAAVIRELIHGMMNREKEYE